MSNEVTERDVEEPIETGWYAYAGGAQTMIFHLRSPGQWSVHLDNGTAADCAWGYIKQACGVWDVVRVWPSVVEATGGDERGRTDGCLPFCQGGLHEVGCTVLPGDA